MTVILSSLRARLEVAERELTVEALKASDGGVSRAANLLGLHRYQLRRLILRHNLQSHVKPHPRGPMGGNDAWRALGAM